MADDLADVRIPLVEERLVTSKQEVETGRVRVRTLVDENEALVRETLRHSTVEVERVTIEREIDEIPPVREEGGVTIIPVVREVLVVQKKLILAEEVHLRRQIQIEEQAQPVLLKTQRAVIERQQSGGGLSTTQEESA
jgi:stress response protein YsnF